MKERFVSLLLERIMNKEETEKFLSTFVALLSLPDASPVRDYILAYLGLLSILLIYHYTGAFVSSHAVIAGIIAILYVVFPDIIPEPIDDVIVASVAVSATIGAVRDFARWIMERHEPPTLGPFASILGKKRESVESFLYQTARRLAGVICSAERDIENSAAKSLQDLMTEIGNKPTGCLTERSEE